MPVFDFQCLHCKKEFTELVLGSETISCPHCQNTKLKKLFSPFYTVSDTTRYETNAKDLPSMEQWARAKTQKPATRQKKPRPKTQKLKMKNLKPRAAVHKR